jgi:hypothetical protein
VPSKHEGGVVATEAERVRDGNLDLLLSRGMRDVVEIAVWVGAGLVDSGGRTPRWSARIVKIASSAPEAPRVWPVAPFVDETGVVYAFSSPRASFNTRVSAASPAGVEVPWAFT